MLKKRGKSFIFLIFFAFIGSAFAIALVDWNDDEICSKDFIQQKMAAYPELYWLLDDKVELTQEGLNIKTKTSWSLRLSENKKHYGEFERSVLSLVILDLILSGTSDSYRKLIKIQKKDQLSKKSFDELHQLAQHVLNLFEERDKKLMVQALETALVLGDMGKTPRARALASCIQHNDHDLFLEEVLYQKRRIFPSFNRLPQAYKDLITQVTGLVHFGYVTHAEGTPKGMLEKIKNSGVMKDPRDPYSFELLVHICDVAAAGGQTNNQGSLFLTEKTYQTLMATKDALYALKDHSEAEALERYMQKRGEWIGVDLKEYPILVRLGCMLRLYSPEDGEALLKAWERLSPEQKQLFQEEFHPFKEYKGFTPTYVPTVLLNIWNSKYGTLNERTAIILEIILPKLVQYIKRHREDRLNLNFNNLAGFCRDHIADLATLSFQLTHDEAGRVSVIVEQ